MNNWLAIFIGGGLGSLARYATSEICKKIFSTSFPFGTLLANVLSCLLFSIFIYVFAEKFQQKDGLFFLIVVGFCGGFSTFSTFSFETFQLIRQQQYIMAALNVIVSIVFCLVVFMVVKDKI